MATLLVTANRTTNDNTNALGSGGEFAEYRYATRAEFDQLVTNAGITVSYGGITDETAFLTLQSHIGVTIDNRSQTGSYGFTSDYMRESPVAMSMVMDKNYCWGDSNHEYECTRYWVTSNTGFIEPQPGLGHFLVKATSGPPADTTPPETSISEGPAALTKQKTASFTFTSNEPNSTFACSLDGAALAPCTSPQAYNDLLDGSHTFEVKVTDTAGNPDTSPASHSWTVDTTAPNNIQFQGMNDGSSFYRDFVAAAPTCSADDATSGVDRCVVTGYSTAVGTHTLTATATDKAGNSDSRDITYTVLDWRIDGFYRPVEMGEGVVNVVKNGSTAVMKFNVYVSGTEITSTAKTVMSVAQLPSTQCSTSLNDEMDLGGTTGSTSLRYSDNQFAYNWQTPKKIGNCYNVTMTYDSGPSITAKFRLR